MYKSTIFIQSPFSRHCTHPHLLDGVAPITVPGISRDTNPIRGLIRVESYKYLGVLIDSKLDHSAWLKQKRYALEHTISALHPVLANHQLTVNYRSRIFSAVVM
ncbi:hypothetical protein BASA60_009992, partial [Batrachochytrium salamandrivorans]